MRGATSPSSDPDQGTMRLALGLSALAALGLGSLLAAPVEALLAIEAPVLTVRALAIVQPAILTAIAIFTGLALSRRTGLGAPYLSGTRRFYLRSAETLKPLRMATIVALVGGLGLSAYQLVSQNWIEALDPVAAEQIAAFAPPLVTRLLYGGLTEEIVSRWGMMTCVAWVLGGRHVGAASRPAWAYVTAAIVAAALLALGHLPLLLALVDHPPLALIVVVLGLNTLVGTAFGWLFWRAGLEAAMLAHAGTHGVATLLVVLASGLGLG